MRKMLQTIVDSSESQWLRMIGWLAQRNWANHTSPPLSEIVENMRETDPAQLEMPLSFASKINQIRSLESSK